MDTKLSVNVNKIATLRNSRGTNVPHLLDWCHKIVSYGAHGITAHPRADRRHITPQDALDICREIKTVETNLEGDIREEFLELVLKAMPTQCTLVPVKPGEITSNYGFDCKTWGFLLKPIILKLKSEGIRVSVFVEAHDLENLDYVKETNADRIEIFTEPYAHAFQQNHCQPEIDHIRKLAFKAKELGLGVNAGHDLSSHNLPLLKQSVPHLAEVSIGHQIMADALEWGMENTIKLYLSILSEGIK